MPMVEPELRARPSARKAKGVRLVRLAGRVRLAGLAGRGDLERRTHGKTINSVSLYGVMK